MVIFPSNVTRNVSLPEGMMIMLMGIWPGVKVTVQKDVDVEKP